MPVMFVMSRAFQSNYIVWIGGDSNDVIFAAAKRLSAFTAQISPHIPRSFGLSLPVTTQKIRAWSVCCQSLSLTGQRTCIVRRKWRPNTDRSGAIHWSIHSTVRLRARTMTDKSGSRVGSRGRRETKLLSLGRCVVTWLFRFSPGFRDFPLFQGLVWGWRVYV